MTRKGLERFLRWILPFSFDIFAFSKDFTWSGIYWFSYLSLSSPTGEWQSVESTSRVFVITKLRIKLIENRLLIKLARLKSIEDASDDRHTPKLCMPIIALAVNEVSRSLFSLETNCSSIDRRENQLWIVNSLCSLPSRIIELPCWTSLSSSSEFVSPSIWLFARSFPEKAGSSLCSRKKRNTWTILRMTCLPIWAKLVNMREFWRGSLKLLNSIR